MTCNYEIHRTWTPSTYSLLDALQQDASPEQPGAGRALPRLARHLPAARAAAARGGLIEREVAILDPERLAPLLATAEAVVEISLDRQDAAALEAFEARVVADEAVQQCYRVSPGPDFVLIVTARDMPGYLALAQRLFTSDANVRNVKAFFSACKRAKFRRRRVLRLAAVSAA